MTALPRQSRNPIYDPANFPDDYVKPMLTGVQALEPRARVINKLGWAYGFVTDAAVVQVPALVE